MTLDPANFPDFDAADSGAPAGAQPDGAAPDKPRRGDREPRPKGSIAGVRRAARFLWPYRGYVLVSIACALFIGLATSGGLAAMLPILRVLFNDQTVREWVDAKVAERRLGVELADDPDEVRIVRTSGDDSPAASAGLQPGDAVRLADAAQAAGPMAVQAATATPATTPLSPSPTRATLAALADPARDAVALAVGGDGNQAVTVALPALPWHWATLRRLASHVSDRPVYAVAQLLGVLLALALVSNVVKFFQEYLADKAAVLAVTDIRRRLYDHVLHVPLSAVAGRSPSDLMSRLVQDCGNLEQGFKTILNQSIQEPIKAIMALGLALLVSWELTLVILLAAPVIAAVIRTFGKKMRRASRTALQRSSRMLAQIDASVSGIRVVKGACAERFERRRYRAIMQNLLAQQLRMIRIDALSAPALETATLLVVGVVVLIAAHMVLVSHTLTVTSFFLVMACLGTIADSLRRVNKVNTALQRSAAAADRVFEVMDLPAERERLEGRGQRVGGGGQRAEVRGQDRAGAATEQGVGGAMSADGRDKGQRTKDQGPAHARRTKLPPLQREVRFENVTFTYPGASSPALLDVDLVVTKGRSVAIVGRNGSGKTTLLALLPRFYDPDAGRVLIDGVDVRDATLRSLRGQISIVSQESVIFPGTIGENIAYGQPRATRAEIEAAARRAFAHDFIMEKPQGYDTVLGGLGGSLSGGQRQRLCIARAILRNAPILILDEATSQVDAESEHLIQGAIDRLIHDRAAAATDGNGDAGRPTTFVIAHRFSTILGADEIVVMDAGRVVARGRHDDLLASCDTYRQLYERQLIAAPAADPPAAPAGVTQAVG